MFRFRKSLDVITLFHAPHKPASIRVHNLLKQATEQATALSSGETVERPITRRSPFELNVTTDFPTPSQLATILDYGLEKGTPVPASVVAGARNKEAALKLFEKSNDNFLRPMVVDWNNGRVVAADKENALIT